jgi:N6-L-threonylcarbamoyladenine synthase
MILAIESSCDETSAAICNNEGEILSNVTATQKVHEQYGGVVPELASRAHLQNIIPVVQTSMEKAGVSAAQIKAVAYTRQPGLLGSLLVGSCFAKSLAQGWQVPLIEVHHMQAHVVANLLNNPAPSFPFLCLTVSGGHTQLVVCHSPTQHEIIGTTLDDAAGEAFDKAAKLLSLPYPGGPLVDKLAKEGNENAFKFTSPQIPELNFSFSGLKTSILYFLQKQKLQNENFVAENINDLCASIQKTIIDILLKKLVKAAEQTGIKELCIAGGVSANSGLRQRFTQLGETNGWKTYIPEFQYCTDNAGMIAKTAYYKFIEGQFSTMNVVPLAR